MPRRSTEPAARGRCSPHRRLIRSPPGGRGGTCVAPQTDHTRQQTRTREHERCGSGSVAPGPRLLVMVLSTWGPRCCRASALAKSNPNTHASAGLAFQCFCYSYILDIPAGDGGRGGPGVAPGTRAGTGR